MIKVRSEEGVVALHLVVDRYGDTQGWVELRLNRFEPHGVLVELLADRLLLLPLLAVLAVEDCLTEGFESVEAGIRIFSFLLHLTVQFF